MSSKQRTQASSTQSRNNNYQRPQLTHEGRYDIQTMSVGPITILKTHPLDPLNPWKVE